MKGEDLKLVLVRKGEDEVSGIKGRVFRLEGRLAILEKQREKEKKTFLRGNPRERSKEGEF